ncbi:UNVERIFIED_CONTAM: hypothetical protein GTU68_018098 [Idotea baltica]|nr:hypothetical protein [Idotea baltica]
MPNTETTNNTALNIVLLHPQIPNNTGNIGRLCVATNCKLHLIEPLGFELSDKYLKRSGLDYWQYLDYTVYTSWKHFLHKQANDIRFYVMSAHAKQSIWQHEYKANDYFVFGKEADGFGEDFLQEHEQRALTIPQYSNNVRCLNLANSVAVTIYEGLRQLEGLLVK